MSSFEKHEKHHSKKKQLFNGGNFLLSPINKKNINSLNYFAVNKKNTDIQSKNDIKVIVNKLNPELIRKKNNNINSEQINNILKVNKQNSLSRPKNINKINNNKFMGTYFNINTSNLSVNKTNNQCGNDLTSDNININNNNLDINSNAYNLKKLYINKKIKDLNVFSKNDSFNNLKKYQTNRQSYDHLKTDLNTSKDTNIKLVIPDRNFFEKKLENHNFDDIIGTPSGLFKKNNQLNIQFNSPGNLLKNYYNNPNIKIHRDEKIIIDSFTNQSTNDSKNKKRKKSIDRSISGKDFSNIKIKKIENKCPEEIHFYYIIMIQKGKKLEKGIDGD